MENINEKIKELYLNKEYTTKQTASELNVSETTIIRRIKKLGIGRGKVKHRNRKDINNNYFSEINTPKKAYLLGFIYADGNNNTKKKGLNFKLQSDDYYIVEELAKEICGEVKYVHSGFYTTPKGYKSYWTKFNVTSRQISEDLENKFGLVARKSKVIRFPFYIEEKYYSHFIRGYFDGDGSVTIHKKPSGENEFIRCSITSNSEEILKDLKTVLEKVDIKSSLYSREKSFTIQLDNLNGVYKFRDYIYKDSDIHLIRKRIKFYKELDKFIIYNKYTTSENHKKLIINALNNNVYQTDNKFKSLKVWCNDLYLGDFGTFVKFSELIGASASSIYSSYLQRGEWKSHTFEYMKY